MSEEEDVTKVKVVFVGEALMKMRIQMNTY